MARIVDMGFSANAAKRGLRANGYVLERALAWVFDRMAEEDAAADSSASLDDPLPPLVSHSAAESSIDAIEGKVVELTTAEEEEQQPPSSTAQQQRRVAVQGVQGALADATAAAEPVATAADMDESTTWPKQYVEVSARRR